MLELASGIVIVCTFLSVATISSTSTVGGYVENENGRRLLEARKCIEHESMRLLRECF